MDRPFTQQEADAICEHIADGKSLRNYCAQEGAPSKSTVMKWLAAHAEFADQYARAREMQADSHVDDLADIADTEADPAKARVRIDARKWAASKLAPKKYGDKLAHVGGNDDDPPIKQDLTVRFIG